MKKLTTLTMGLLLILGACTEEESRSNSSMESLSLKSIRDKNGLLFTYSTPSERIDKAKTAVYLLTTEAKELIQISEGLTHIISFVDVGNGKGILKELYYLDISRNLIVDSYELNLSTGFLEDVGGGTPIYNPSTGVPMNPNVDPESSAPCPLGSVHLGNCTFGPTYGDCLEGLITDYESDNDSHLSTNSYQLTNSAYDTQICASTSEQ